MLRSGSHQKSQQLVLCKRTEEWSSLILPCASVLFSFSEVVG